MSMLRAIGKRWQFSVVRGQAITVTAGSGTLTTVSGATINYVKLGPLVIWQATFTITTNGTGATDLRFTFPFTVQGIAPLYGWETANGFQLGGYISGTLTTIWSYDGTYPGADGRSMRVAGVAHT